MRKPTRSITGGRAMAAALALALAWPGVSTAAPGEDTALGKAGRGLAAMTCGFLELPGNMVLETRRRGPAYGLTLGFVKGLGGIVVRELVGVYEFVTAPIEAPPGYQPILSPEYPWDYFDGESRVADDRHPTAAPGLGSGGPPRVAELEARSRRPCDGADAMCRLPQ